MVVWLRQILAFLFLLAGGLLLVHSAYTSLHWIFQVAQLAEQPNLSRKYGLQIGMGVLLLVVAFIFWYPALWSTLPYGILIAIIAGGSAALNMHIRQNNARRLSAPNRNRIEPK